MAELDFDNEDDNLDDLGDSPQSIIGEEPERFWSRKRLLITIAVITGVFALGAVLYSMRVSDAPPALKPGQKGQPAEKKKKKGKIKYQKLFGQLTLEQQSNIIRELSFAGIDFETEQNGSNYTIMVDQEELEHAKSLLAIKGIPSGGSKGYELLDNNQTLGITEFDKRIRFLRALAGELERAIIQFDGIESCKVQIVLPEQKLFSVTQPPVTASILVRRKLGHELTDENVHSIIQLVANAVENLQPENISVIDTEGRVLSTGIFERLAQRENRKANQAAAAASQNAEPSTNTLGAPIVPDFKQMNKWLEVKRKYEKELEDKAIRQLLGILPVGSFKLSITADLASAEEGKVPEVLRLTVSIVVDGNNKDIYLDEELKSQIFNTVAGAIGYIKNRDNIILTRADFFQISQEELRRQKNLKNKKSIWKWAGLGGASVVAGLITYWGIRRLRRGRELPDILNPNRQELDTNFEFESNRERIQEMAATNPGVLADLLDGWVKESGGEG
jgi:flagellar biosynthesis/type III secretory pathway M-ring protein FliF/YscJ